MRITQTQMVMERVEDALAILTTKVKLSNARGRTDINADAEDFYCGLLNIVLNKNLQNQNLLEMDFPAIDLADGPGRLCVQVTSTEDREKITSTLEKFFARELDKDFDRLMVLIIGRKGNYQRKFATERSFDFQKDRDIWDTARLLREIERLEPDQLEAVDAYLLKQLSFYQQERNPLLNLPLRTAMNERHFMGRETELAEIAKRFETERIVVLSGLGGIGKTELAVRFARQYDGGQTYFVGFRRDFHHTVTDGIALGVEGLVERKPDEATKYRETMKVLNQCGKRDLLIIDNADTEEAGFEQLRYNLSFLPMRVLITTRCDAVDRIDVNALHREELHRIFRLYNESITEADMDALIDAVDAHTLTVDLMARSMRHGRRAATAEKLLTALNKRDLNSPSFMQIATNYPGGLRQARINEHLRTVFQVAKLSDDEKTLLRCATLLPTGGMSDELFMFPFVEEMQDVLDGLIQKGWLLWENDLLKIHPVICIVCREELKPTREACHAFVVGVWGWYDKKKYDHANFRQMAELLEGASDTLGDPDGWYIGEAGYLWNELSESQQALKCNLRAVELREQSQPDSNSLANAYHNVGSTYVNLGDQAKALEYLRKALAIREKVLPQDHPGLATSCNDLGITYGHLGDHKKGLEYHLKALAIYEKVLPPDHPFLATSYNNVGGTYGDLGDHNMALEYLLKALAIREKVLPQDHPDLASSYNNVGSTYSDLGDHNMALEYKLKDLAICEKVLPQDHPDLASSYNNAGSTYGDLGDHNMALEYKLKALAIQEKVLPPDHPYNAICCNNIAWSYYALGNLQEAARFMRRAADIAARSLPEGHPHRTAIQDSLERMERKARQRAEA